MELPRSNIKIFSKRNFRILRILVKGKLSYAKRVRKWMMGQLFKELQILAPVYYQTFKDKYGKELITTQFFDVYVDDKKNCLMELPEKKSQSVSTGQSIMHFIHSPGIKRVNHLNGSVLVKLGWERKGTTYTKDNHIIKYDGVNWTYDGEQVQFLEDLNDK